MYETGTITTNHFDLSAVANNAASWRSKAPIQLQDWTVDIGNIVEELKGDEAWNKYGARQTAYRTPHQQIDDIWVRYNSIDNFKGDLHAFNARHKSEWYSVAGTHPRLRELSEEVLEKAGGGTLGGVLITRIPPGGGVAPHTDSGWHASYYYDKYAVQLQGNQEQAFCFRGHEVRAEPGQVYWFDNQQEHWVINDSDEYRMTMIVCIRPEE